jgi:hypothetical protein
MFPVWLVSDRLKKKDVVFAVVVEGRPKAYPLELLKKERVAHDKVGSKELVLVSDRASGAVRAFVSGGRRFRPGRSSLELLEVATGAVWKLTEDALVREGSGETLARLPGHTAFWFGWYAFYPTTELYAGATAAPAR